MVQRFCQSEKGRASLSKARNDNAPFPAVRYRGIDQWGINHDFKVEWKRGCNTMERVQGIQLPLGEPPTPSPNCVDLMRANYDNCDNGGVGGSVQVGCLIFTYNGGRGGTYW
ncbi:hypothetical protein CMUS01_12799 [Colletotrichum musicola]|uniref:Uncharacterized protein n=1 Tax=Colletotrichum musicola TaxID=2175873 RepID=A0A8H6MZ65_9PEZI|nr:hypothetical protein CMUS01_12799 [Colletotrichum musicola]